MEIYANAELSDIQCVYSRSNVNSRQPRRIFAELYKGGILTYHKRFVHVINISAKTLRLRNKRLTSSLLEKYKLYNY